MTDITHYSFEGKKVLIRVDFNVPLNERFEITDDTRIKAALPTIQFVLEKGGSVILMSHLGRPKNGPDDRFSLKHVISHLSEVLHKQILFAEDCIGSKAETAAKKLAPGDVLLLENLRFHKEEKAGDPAFAKALAQLAEVYVNDAFGTAHRAHASTAVIAQYFDPADKMFGLLMKKELENADRVLHRSEKPFTAILGGAKVSDKILIIENLLDKVQNMIIGGGMAYTFLKAQGKEIGSSLCEEDKLDLAREILKKAKAKGVQLLLPTDSVYAEKFDAEAKTKVWKNDEVEKDSTWMGLDIGEESVRAFSKVISDSKTILWNGPMGVFELEAFQKGTGSVAKAVAKATENGAFSLVGGGDSVAAVNQFKLKDSISFVSTGGGALLEFFEGKELPAVKYMEKE